MVNQIIVQESPTITEAMAEDRLPDATKNYNQPTLVASLRLRTCLAARRAADTRRRAHLWERAIGYVVATPATWHALFVAVGPKADAIKAGDAIRGVPAKPVLPARRLITDDRSLANRAGTRAHRVHAGDGIQIPGIGRAGALLRAVSLDVCAVQGDASAVGVLITRSVNAGAKAGDGVVLAEMTLRAVDVCLTGHTPVDARTALA